MKGGKIHISDLNYSIFWESIPYGIYLLLMCFCVLFHSARVLILPFLLPVAHFTGSLHRQSVHVPSRARARTHTLLGLWFLYKPVEHTPPKLPSSEHEGLLGHFTAVLNCGWSFGLFMFFCPETYLSGYCVLLYT